MRKIDRNKNIQLLLQDGRELYHTQDLMVLWSINNSSTLYTTISRYLKRGILHSIYKGFYSTKPLKDIDCVYLGMTSVHRYNYLSTESILAREGLIAQDVKYITLVSNISKRFKIKNQSFLVRKMKEEYLLNRAGIIWNKKNREATLERAVADMLYFNSNYNFDGERIINWKKVKEIQKAIGY